MKTILKFPVYVEIDTDNVDRAKVTSAANKILYPQLLSYAGNTSFRRSIMKEFKDAAGVDFAEIKLLTEVDLFKDRK